MGAVAGGRSRQSQCCPELAQKYNQAKQEAAVGKKEVELLRQKGSCL
ncbi:hypothetical protein CbuK_A0025 (plasmid) [Coxiella burnetii CbuK_Q154]|nr:hypothetical protein CbuK_A0025 [Coxiella burnetii CbuK_Q154]